MRTFVATHGLEGRATISPHGTRREIESNQCYNRRMAKKKDNEEAPCFEDALKELDAIAHDLEDGSLGLDESLQRFEQGIGLLRHCYGVLDAAERKIALLTGFDSDGNPVTEPFDATATAEQGVAGRRKKRSSRAEVECDDEGDESSSNGGLF